MSPRCAGGRRFRPTPVSQRALSVSLIGRQVWRRFVLALSLSLSLSRACRRLDGARACAGWFLSCFRESVWEVRGKFYPPRRQTKQHLTNKEVLLCLGQICSRACLSQASEN